MDKKNYTFSKISEKNGLVVYYTNPKKAKSNKNTGSILEHYTTSLSTIGEKKWQWIFDADGFDISYVLDARAGTRIANCLKGTCGDNLQEIKIINPTWHIKTIINALWPFLNNNIKQKIKYLDDRVYSVLEFI